MTTTQITRWYVARPGMAPLTPLSVPLRGWYRSKTSAVIIADEMYANGITAPLVVAAPNSQAARDKAFRCYQGKITTRQAANPSVA